MSDTHIHNRGARVAGERRLRGIDSTCPPYTAPNGNGNGRQSGLAGNLFCDASAAGRVLRGVCIYSGSTRLAELAARIGYDTVWIEMEHGPADFNQVESMCVAIEAGGAIPTVRVPDGQRHHVLRALEVGARIVVVPMVDTAAQARQIAEFGKFPPVGMRGYNTRSRGVSYGLTPVEESFAQANARTHLFAQIETLEAVNNLHEICAVEGLTGIFIGPGDLSSSVGCPGDLNNPRLVQLVSDCARVARAADKHAGILIGPGTTLDAAEAAGCDLIFSGGDVTDLSAVWTRLLASARRVVTL